MTLVDRRNKVEFSKAHIPRSVNIQDTGAFSNWAGWILDYNKPFMLVAPKQRIPEIIKALIRIGLDNVYGFITDIDDWVTTGKPVESVNEISPRELEEALVTNNIQVVDVRGAVEYENGHLRDTMNIHVGHLTDNIEKLPRNKNLVVQCVSGDRSSLAYSLLVKHGIRNVMNLTGGINAWLKEGFATEK